MKITWKHGGRSIEFEHQPMKEGRFRALCGLAWGVIGGGGAGGPGQIGGGT